MLWRPCGCYGTVSSEGNRHKCTEKSHADEKSIQFPFSHPDVTDFAFPTSRRPRFSLYCLKRPSLPLPQIPLDTLSLRLNRLLARGPVMIVTLRSSGRTILPGLAGESLSRKTPVSRRNLPTSVRVSLRLRRATVRRPLMARGIRPSHLRLIERFLQPPQAPLPTRPSLKVMVVARWTTQFLTPSICSRVFPVICSIGVRSPPRSFLRDLIWFI